MMQEDQTLSTASQKSRESSEEELIHMRAGLHSRPGESLATSPPKAAQSNRTPSREHLTPEKEGKVPKKVCLKFAGDSESNTPLRQKRASLVCPQRIQLTTQDAQDVKGMAPVTTIVDHPGIRRKQEGLKSLIRNVEDLKSLIRNVEEQKTAGDSNSIKNPATAAVGNDLYLDTGKEKMPEDMLNQSGWSVMSQNIWNAYTEFGIRKAIVYLFTMLMPLYDYIEVKYAYIRVVVLFSVDVVDTVSDIFIAVGQERRDILGLMIIALFLGFWQLSTQAMLLFRGKGYITASAYHQNYKSDETNRRHFHAITNYSRCMGEDGLVIVVSILNSKRIEGLNRLWFGITLLYVLYAILSWVWLFLGTCSSIHVARKENEDVWRELLDLVIIGAIIAVFIPLWIQLSLLYSRDIYLTPTLVIALFIAAAFIILGAILSLGYCQGYTSRVESDLWWYGPYGKPPQEGEGEKKTIQDFYILKALANFEKDIKLTPVSIVNTSDDEENAVNGVVLGVTEAVTTELPRLDIVDVM